MFKLQPVGTLRCSTIYDYVEDILCPSEHSTMSLIKKKNSCRLLHETWQCIFCVIVVSAVTESQSHRAPLGSAVEGDLDLEGALNKSSRIMRYHNETYTQATKSLACLELALKFRSNVLRTSSNL